MAASNTDRAIQSGLLDRLIDTEPYTREEAPMTRAESLRQLRRAVKRDIEWLLNTTRIDGELPDLMVELRKSVWNYGFPDINSVTLNSTQDEQRLLRSLEQAITSFEPRLKRVRATTDERISKSRQSINFHIEAMLMIDPAPERIVFDTVLEVAKGSYKVKE
jgi:type VI secretion system protein ImpF